MILPQIVWWVVKVRVYDVNFSNVLHEAPFLHGTQAVLELTVDPELETVLCGAGLLNPSALAGTILAAGEVRAQLLPLLRIGPLCGNGKSRRGVGTATLF